jgi:hypothetical protein
MKSRILFSVVGVFAVAALLRADRWQAPTPRVFGSQWGGHGFKILNPKFGGPSQGVLFRLDANGKEQTAWDVKLLNTPHQVIVDDQGRFVATVDTYGNLGYAHALVIYGPKGKVLEDFKLEDLLTDEEIMKHVRRTESSRWWAGDTDFGIENGALVLRLKWGKVIRVDGTTGKIAAAK